MSAKCVGLVVAMSAEARALTGRRQPAEQVVELADNVFLRVGGMGAAAAEANCLALVEAGAGALASVGCAAGLTPECRPGALVVPAQVRSPQGEVFVTDTAWRTALLAGLSSEFSPLLGGIAGVNAITGAAEKRALKARTGAVAADMESAAVARVARRRGLPMIALRAVSDGPDEDVPEALLGGTDAFGRARFRSVLGALVRGPRDAAALARLRAGFNKACATLSHVVERTGPALCCPQDDG